MKIIVAECVQTLKDIRFPKPMQIDDSLVHLSIDPTLKQAFVRRVVPGKSKARASEVAE